MKEAATYYWELIERGSWEKLTNEEKTYVNSTIGKEAYLEDLRIKQTYSKSKDSGAAINRAALLAYAGKKSNSKFVYTLITGAAAGFAIAFLLNLFGTSTSGQLPEIRTVAHYDTVTVEKTIHDTVYKDRIVYSQPKTYSVSDIIIPDETNYIDFSMTKSNLDHAVIENKGTSGFDPFFNQNFVTEIKR